MMILMNIIKRSGLFHYMAITTVKLAKADPVKLLFFFPVLAGILAAFMDAVTAAILLAPIVLLICNILEIDHFPYLISIGIAVNIGGTATMVVDPPNVMIGSAADLTFLDFLKHIAPVSAMALLAMAFTMKQWFRRGMKTKEEMQKYLLDIDARKAITDRDLARKSLWIMGSVVTAFILHGLLHLEVATIAVAGASLLLFITKIKPHKIFEESDFLSIFFFIGLFISVGAMENTGVMDFLSAQIFHLTEGHPLLLTMAILWFAAVASSIVDNIPLVACMIPLIRNIPAGNMDIRPLWYALSLGACMGGNGTLIGASSNMVLAGISEKYGEKISFFKFTRYGFPIMLGTLIMSSIYLFLRYF